MALSAAKLRIVRPVKKPPSLHLSVQESVKAYIEDNKLSAGDALPPEGVLAQQLGVSRNSAREAFEGWLQEQKQEQKQE